MILCPADSLRGTGLGDCDSSCEKDGDVEGEQRQRVAHCYEGDSAFHGGERSEEDRGLKAGLSEVAV